jgi:hypothetical protein
MAIDEREYARKRAEQRQQSSWYKLKEGDNCFRILPTPPSDDVQTNWFEYAVHREVGPKKTTVRCGIDPVSGEGQCWICDKLIPHLKAKKLEQRATALAPRANVLIQVAKVDENGKMTGPYLFTPAKTLADQLLASIFGSRKRSYIDPVRGYNINVSRTGTGRLDTKYGMLEPDQDSTAVPKTLLAKVQPFSELKEVPVYSQAKQQAAYSGKDVAEEPEQDEEEPPRRRARVAAPVEEEEVADAGLDDDELATDDVGDEDLVDDPDPDAEEEPAPPRRAAKPAAKPAARPAARRAAPVEEEEPEAELAGDDEELLEDDLPDEIDLNDLGDEPPLEEEEEAPAPKPRAAAKPAARPAAKPAARPASKVAVPAPKPKARR